MASRTVEVVPDLDDLAFKAMRVLGAYLDSPAKQRDIEQHRAARVASSVLGTWATVRQTENNAEALRLMAARELAGENSAKFKEALLGNGHKRRLPAGRRRR